MKKRKILYLFPLAALILSGCTFQEGLETAKSFFGENIYEPIKGFVEKIFGKKSDEKDDNKDDQKGDDSQGGGDGQQQTETVHGSLENPLSLAEFCAKADELIDYSTVASKKTVTDQNNLFYIKGKVRSNEAAQSHKIRFTNLIDAEDSNVAVTVYYAYLDGDLEDEYSAADSMAGGEIVVRGYASLYNNNGKTYELTSKNKEDEDNPMILKVEMPEPTAEPAKIQKTVAEIAQCQPTKSQAYISRGVISSWADSAGGKSQTKPEYGNLFIKDLAGDTEIYVYGSSAVATDLAWNGSTGEYKMTNSKAFLTNALTKDLAVGDTIDFWGTYYEYKGLREMDMIITGKVDVEPTGVQITSGNQVVVGYTLNLAADVLPSNAPQDVEWSIVSGAEYATLENAVLTGTAAGTVKVRATASGFESVYDEMDITVKAPDKVLVESITASPESIEMSIEDDPVQVALTITPANIEEEITCTVSPEGIISVDQKEMTVSPVAEGEATIRVEGAESHEGVTIPVTVNPKITSMKDVYEAALNNTGGDEVFTFEGVVVGIKGGSFYVQDGDYGMYVYASSLAEGVEMGKQVRVSSKVTVYNGLPETTGSIKVKVLGNGTLPTPIEITSKAILDAAKINVLANAPLAVYKSKTKDWTSSNTSVRFTFTIGGSDLTLNMDKNGYDEDKAAIFNNATAGDAFSLGNILTNAYNTTMQLAFAGNTSTITEVIIAPESVQITNEETELGVGGSLGLTATVGPTGAPQDVVWSIESGADYADLEDNVLTGKAAGTVKVRATVKDHSDIYDEKDIEIKSGVETKSYSKVTSIALNDSVTLVCEGQSKYLTGISDTTTHYGLNGDIPNPFNTSAFGFTVVAGSEEDTFAFKTGDNKYLCWSSGNSLDVSSTLDANSSWAVSFNASGNAALLNSADNARQIWFNTSSPRFACYTNKTESTSGYAPIQIYALQ